MKCEKIQKWISDLIDRELSERKKKILMLHLEKCASCRLYQDQIRTIHAEVQNLKMPGVSSDAIQESLEKVKKRLLSEGEEKKGKSFQYLRKWRWAYSSVLLVFTISIFLLFFLPRFKSAERENLYVFSFEEALGDVYREIGDDGELEDLFDSIILSSIEDILVDSQLTGEAGFFDNTLFWEELSEEELKLIESEIKKGKTS